ncbi:hypothetical protein [Streptomyces sp. NPDC001415]
MSRVISTASTRSLRSRRSTKVSACSEGVSAQWTSSISNTTEAWF